MEKNRSYIPVGCDFVDLIEIHATRKDQVQLKYRNGQGTDCLINTRLVTWETRNKVEYLITSDPLEIRLDDVISINGHVDEKRCSI
ncbi:hypothetical protein [Portibacter lacus]|uniref:Transcriptional antiterminator, Rof n=1 Tax=Portibacter lacus TaxID=1099794 RepID=A0AA37SNE4_9BACT|nr:hypothetical protein [Portibacter lacus]GLR16297.1 hypothetical protein GCM10007940_09120 [Portibacter lacus]